jgi:hypothetical protein
MEKSVLKSSNNQVENPKMESEINSQWLAEWKESFIQL